MTFDSSIAEQSQVTQCPNCKTAFHISEEQLLVASGQVRCGSCLTIFQADKYWLADAEPAAPDTSASTNTPSSGLGGQPTAQQRTPDADSLGASPGPTCAPDHEDNLELSDSFLDLGERSTAESSFAGYETDEAELEDTQEEWAQALLEEEEPEERQAPRNDVLSAILESPEGQQQACDPDTPDAMSLNGDTQIDLAPDQINGAEKWMQQVLGQEPPAEQITAHSDTPPPTESGSTTLAQLEEPTEEYVPEVFRKPKAKQQRQAGSDNPVSGLAQAASRLHALQAPLLRWLSRALISLAFVTAIAVLVLQMTWHQAQQQPAGENPHPLLASICALVGCTFPEPQAEQLLIRQQTAVFRSTTQPGVIALALEFHNPSENPGHYPILLATFIDKQGRTVASGTFTPSQYLSTAKLRSTDESKPVKRATILPGQTVQILLQLSDPGSRATDYRVSAIKNQT